MSIWTDYAGHACICCGQATPYVCCNNCAGRGHDPDDYEYRQDLFYDWDQWIDWFDDLPEDDRETE